MSEYPYHFEAEVELLDFGNMAYSVVYVPSRLKKQLPLKEHPRLRIDGEVNGIRINAAFQPSGSGWYLMLSKKFRQICGLQVGQVATVHFDIADQNAVSVPGDLQFALDADESAARAWEALTAGKRRGLAYRVDSAKMVETRERRIEEVLQFLKQQG